MRSPAAPSPVDVLENFEALAPPGTPLTTAEVAAEFDCTDRTVSDRLAALVDEGELATKEVGAEGRVWWRPPDGVRDAGKTGRPLDGRGGGESHPVVDAEMVGVIVWGGDFTIRDANDAFLEMAGLEYREALGTSWRELTPEEFYPASERHIEEIEATGAGTPYEKQYYHGDGSRWWGLFESRRVSDDEVVEFVVDVTERKRQEERQRFLVELNDALQPLADTDEILAAAAGHLGNHLDVSQVGYTIAEADEDSAVVGGEYGDGRMPDLAEHRFKLSEYSEEFRATLCAGEAVFFDDFAEDPRTPAGESAEADAIATRAGALVPLHRDDRLVGWLYAAHPDPRPWPDHERRLIRDVLDRTRAAVERARAEQALQESEEKFRAVANLVPDLLWSNDPDGSASWHNQQWYDYTGQTPEEAGGDGWLDAIHPDDRERSLANFEDGVGAGEPLRHEHRIRRHDGEYRWFLVQVRPVEDDGEVTRWFGAATDIHDRQSVTAALERLTEASHELIDADTGTIADRAAELARDVLDVEYAALWRYDETAGELREHASHVAPGSDVGTVGLPDGFGDEVWETFVGGAVAVGTDRGVSREATAGPPLRSWVLVPLGRHGVLCVGSAHSGTVDESTVDLAETTAATVETAWDRAEGEQQLAEHNEELERLDRLNALIRGIDQALVDAGSREAIERAVCDRLAGSELYEFAWIGERDLTTETVVARERAGVDRGYVETVAFPTDGVGPDADPVATAARTGELQVVADVAIDPRVGAWREATLDRGARSCIAIPLEYNDSKFGVLAVYAGDPQPDERDHAVLAELGETIAHAIDAVETKRTLLTDRVAELTLEVRGAGDALAALAREADCEVALDGFVPGRDGAARLFFTADECAVEAVLAAGTRLPGVAGVDRVSDDGSTAAFEATVTGATVASCVVDEGGLVRSLTVADGTATVVVDLPADASVREFVERVREAYPDTELVARTSRDRAVKTRRDLREALSARFTDRQREVLEVAYRSGYFESPRVRTGQELSEALAVTQSTFSHHLREAERRLCELVFENA